MKKKGFTLIELLVVISIIAMLMAILMPALGKVKKLANQVVCGTKLKGLGTACMVYANENDDGFPVAGKKGTSPGWVSKNGQTAYWDEVDQSTGAWSGTGPVDMTVSASLYLLVREADVSPKQFVCNGSDEKEFEAMNAKETNGEAPDYEDLWDFGSNVDDEATGGNPSMFVSYAYHMPYKNAGTNWTARPLNSASQSASMAVMADKNPFFDSAITDSSNNIAAAGDEEGWETKARIIVSDWDSATSSTSKWEKEINNSNNHERAGQNVLFMDSHVSFEKRADIGSQGDNIYTIFQDGGTSYTEDAKRQGIAQNTCGIGISRTVNDAFLVNDDDGK